MYGKYLFTIILNLPQSMDGLQSSKENKDKGIVVVGATNKVYLFTNFLKP